MSKVVSVESEQKNIHNLKIAIVHDALCVKGGAEKFILSLAKAFPDAPIFTSVYLKDETFQEFSELNVVSLRLSRWIKSAKQFKSTYPIWLALIRLMDWSEYDLVISSSTYLAKYIKVLAPTKHLAFIHAPFRFLWKTQSYTSESLPLPRLVIFLLRKLLPVAKKWDRKITRSIDHILANSDNVRKEIEEVYGKEVGYIHPPINVAEFEFSAQAQDYYLIVSRLISHKRIDFAIDAFNHLGYKLVIVGDGLEKKRLMQMANPNIEFLGKVSDAKLKALYKYTRAFIFTSNEDYGIAPIEAQASGKPVIAFGKGGVLETVNPGKTGLFYNEQTADSLIECIKNFEKMEFDHIAIAEWAKNFDETQFIIAFRSHVEALFKSPNL